jgi:hypothetical protein
MSLEDRFRKLKKDQDESIKRWEQAEKDKVRETEKTIQALSSGVSKVCRAFCDAMKWDIDVTKNEYGRYLTLSSYKYSFEVIIHRDAVVVHGRYSGDSSSWQDSTSIQVKDFTDDKLAQVLEKSYREHMLLP